MPSTPRPSDARHSAIIRIELVLTSLPFDAGRRDASTDKSESIDSFNASSKTFTAMESLMVAVTTADGVTGWGEAFGHKTNPATWAALEQMVAPFFIGQPADPAAVRRDAEYAFHAFGRTGPVHYALSAIDIALWDIAAQREELPLRSFIAQRRDHTAAPRESVRTYASLVHYGEDPVEVAFHIARARADGFTAFKLHESTRDAIAAARRAAGAEARLMVDVNCAWDEAGADAALSGLADLNLHWLEEPVFPPDDSPALARLNRRHGVVSAGENASGVHGLVADMTAGAVSVAQPSVGKIGGITSMLEVYDAGARLGVPVVPHNFYYGPALAAAAQVIAAMPVQLAGDGSPHPELEVPFLTWPQRLHSLHGAHQDDSGADASAVVLPSAPGLGFAPDPDILEAATIRRAKIS
ncbi:mandelate racemase/muconate lactonizing enzyme family protein [Zhihengliuella halotolerans]|uniref:L-alanine-DL-glutamate epimerase-like enolase superfamily enzyme n=1 Tax=Zhihengliuella halotolerans TaxID=370736 RepID=A0A4Q8AE81_9MICC|nr:mandelate racemase/muconate lactonizing enzyme family protein [Zhihengliuella halotolerans]RZU62528.1 L-alanine-DL-glutamate epimerase-like enolase superfamily enzyme [Zhihengliuella halotolerans]